MRHLWIGLAGAAGALSRYLLGLLAAGLIPSVFPWGTLVINVVGCLVLGLVVGFGYDRGLLPEPWRAPVAVGFIGAFTTFSTWTVDTVRLFEIGHPGLAIANVAISLVLGLAATAFGLRAAGRPAPSLRRD